MAAATGKFFNGGRPCSDLQPRCRAARASARILALPVVYSPLSRRARQRPRCCIVYCHLCVRRSDQRDHCPFSLCWGVADVRVEAQPIAMSIIAKPLTIHCRYRYEGALPMFALTLSRLPHLSLLVRSIRVCNSAPSIAASLAKLTSHLSAELCFIAATSLAHCMAAVPIIATIVRPCLGLLLQARTFSHSPSPSPLS